MSAKTTGIIWDLKISVPWRVVLLAMVDHADHDGAHMRASQAYIAWKTGYSSRNIARIIQDMRDAGMLVLTHDALGEENEYQFNLAAAQYKPAFKGRTPRGVARTHDKMSGVPHDKMSTPHDKMSTPHDKMSGVPHDKMSTPHDMLAIDSKYQHDSNSSSNRSRERNFLRKVGFYNGAIDKILAMDIDWPTLEASIIALSSAGWGVGAIYNELKDNPPTKGHPYEQPQSGLGSHAAPAGATRLAPRSPERARRSAGSHNPTGGAELHNPGWMDRELAKVEAILAEERARAEL